MRRLALPVLLFLGLVPPSVALAGGSPSRPPRPVVAKKVWSSEEVEALRARGLISLVGQESRAEETRAAQPPAEGVALSPTPRPIRAKDPLWYREQAGEIRAAMEVNNAEIRLILRELREARYWEPGVNLNKENVGITPDSALQILAARNQQESEELDALQEKARRNGIVPGALR